MYTYKCMDEYSHGKHTNVYASHLIMCDCVLCLKFFVHTSSVQVLYIEIEIVNKTI